MNPIITRTNLNDINHGHCGNRNNARYSGRTRVFVVSWGQHSDWACPTKWLATEFAKYIERVQDGDGGDPEMGFRAAPEGARYLASNLEIKPCFRPASI